MMMKESSVMSQSATESISKAHGRLDEIEKLKLGSVIPLFDNLAQFATVHPLIYYILTIEVLIQIMALALWIPGHDILDNHARSRGLRDILYEIACFTPLELTDQVMEGAFIGLTVLFIVQLAFVGFVVLDYRRKRRFARGILSSVRFCVEIVPTVMMMPFAAFTGQMFRRLFHNPNTEHIVFFALSLIQFAAVQSEFWLATMLLGSSPYLAKSPIVSFDPGPFVSQLGVTSLSMLVSIVVEQFIGWLVYVVIAAHFLFCLFNTIQMVYRPFLHVNTNSLFMSAIIYSMCMDIVRIVTEELKTSGLIVFVLFIALIPIAVVASSVFFLLQTRTLKRNLVIPDSEFELQDTDKIAILTALNLGRSAKNILLYFDFAVTNHLMEFIDLFFIRYIMTTYDDSKVEAHCIRIMSWFPGHIRTLNYMFGTFLSRRDITIYDRFLMYQLQKIRVVRQSSSSISAVEKLGHVKQAAKEVDMLLGQFWDSQDYSITSVHYLSRLINRTDNLWEEATEDFPNSIQFYDDYCSYLIETTTQFTEAIRQKHRADMVEAGSNLSVDRCFRQFIRCFPEYLKLHILDLRGNFIKKTHGKGSASSSNIAGKSSLSLSTGSMDMALEEGIGKSIMTSAKMRLTLERAMANRKMNMFPKIVYMTIFLMAVNLAVFLFLFVFFLTFFDKKSETIERIEISNQVRLNLMAAGLSGVYYWGNGTGVIDSDNVVAPYRKVDADLTSFISPARNFQENLMYFAVLCRANYDLLLINVAGMAVSGEDVWKYAAALFESDTEITFCMGSKRLNPYKTNLRSTLSYLFMCETLLLAARDLPKWWVDEMVPCATFSTLKNVIESFQSLRKTLAQVASDDTHGAAALFLGLQWGLSVGLFVFCEVLFMIVSGLLIKELNYFVSLLLKLPKEVKRECGKPLRKDAKDDDSTDRATGNASSMRTSNRFSVTSLFNSVISVLFLAMAALVCGQVTYLSATGDKFNYLSDWTFSAAARKSVVVELCMFTSLAVLQSGPMMSGADSIRLDELKTLIDRESVELETLRQNIMGETDTSPSSMGYDSVIDQLTMNTQCDPNRSDPSYHEMYRCASAIQILEFFLNAVHVIMIQLDDYGGNIGDEITAQIIHMTSTHILPKLLEIDEQYGKMSTSFKSNFVQVQLIFLVVELVVACITLGVIVVYITSMNSCYSAAISLLRRVSPIHIVAHKRLEAYALNKSIADENETMSTDQGIMHNSSDGILVMDSHGVVEIMNPAVAQTFGYTPEQLLGQPVTILLSAAAKMDVESHIQLMRDRQSALAFEGHTVCVSADEAEIPCSISILGITDDSEVIGSFVIILRDESLLLSQQREAERAKKQSETLLFQILPRDIVIRLNAGEHDISFSVPSSTIMFIDIVKFSDYASSLTPQDIMGNLSGIFGAFDEALAKYPLLIKIKLIGDVYMCAGGLFNPDDPSVSHAEQMVRFGLEALQALDEANIRLNSGLNVRIGVNTGGPLIAGVLGTDKPTFDIIGDPINVASRLQSTDIAGRIQISQATYDLVSKMDFQIEERGEVFLKGKGKSVAYLVNLPRDAFTTSQVSCDLSMTDN